MLDPIRFLSVCSGIEAASVAWQPLGWSAAAVSEIDPFPCHVLHHRHGAGRPLFMPDPDEATGSGLKALKDRRARAAAIKAMATVPEAGRIPNLGDMNRFKDWPDADVSLLVGGTPCQSFSVAGLRRGLDDPRGNLALTYLAIADRYRPEWVVWENVPGVLSSNGGRDFGAFLGGLVKLGYGFAYRVLDAQYVRTRGLPWAVPQRRRRVFVVGYLGDWRPAAAALFDRQSLRGDPPPRRRAVQGFARAAAQGVAIRGRDGGGTAELSGPISTAIRASQGGGDKPHVLAPAIANPLPARMHKGVNTTMDEGQTMVAYALRGEGFEASEDGTGRGTPIVPVAFDCKASQPHGVEDGSSPTLKAMGHADSHANAGGQLAVAFDTTQITAASNYSVPKPGDPCHPLAAGAHPPAIAFDAQAGGNTGLAIGDEVAGALHGGGKHGGRSAVATRWAVRRLSVRECERLQGFPDDFTDVPYRGRNATPDGPRYKALGNSMAVNAMQWIGERIELVRGIMEESR